MKPIPLSDDPGRPMMLLLLPTLTFVAPVMAPLMKTMAGSGFVSETAALSSARVVTVVALAPRPPVVLSGVKGCSRS